MTAASRQLQVADSHDGDTELLSAHSPLLPSTSLPTTPARRHCCLTLALPVTCVVTTRSCSFKGEASVPRTPLFFDLIPSPPNLDPREG